MRILLFISSAVLTIILVIESIWGGPKSCLAYEQPRNHILYFVFLGLITILSWILAFTYPMLPYSKDVVKPEISVLTSENIDILLPYLILPFHRMLSYLVFAITTIKTSLFVYHEIRQD